MKVMICDDEPLARDRLTRMLARIDDVTLVGEAQNGRELLLGIQLHSPDIVLTDIRMPTMDGLEAATHIANLDQPPAIVFCSAYDEYAIKAFQVQAIGYLLKPIRQNDLEDVIRQASKVNKAQLASVRQEMGGEDVDEPVSARQCISVKSHRGLELIPISDIRYFKADQKYVTVRYSEGEVLVDETLKELEDELVGRFVRVHRNALVSLAHLEAVENLDSGYQVRLQGVEEKVVISRRHVAVLKKRLQAM
ncbi:DNA-binding response regulator [Gammaproteobacteria bacterium 45_16_T64]|nr:DNA-binding response regulator [Gammaproteobacteria bacterium 45_16_T64]